MSEFSESYHLRSERLEDAVELLRRAGLKGYVYQPANGWVTFLAEGGVFEPDQRIVAAAQHPLLHYVNAEDHGWSFSLFDKGHAVSRYSCEWDNEIRFNDSGYSRAALQQLVPSVQPALLDDFERWLRPGDFDQLLEAEPARLLAQGLGLEHYEWLSYDYVHRDRQDSSEDHSEVTEVT
jgi:hypothetical protein